MADDWHERLSRAERPQDEREAILHGAPTLGVQAQPVPFPASLSDGSEAATTTTTDSHDQEATMGERFKALTNLRGGGTTVPKYAEFDPRSIGLGGAALERQIALGNIQRIPRRSRARLTQPAEAHDVSHAVPDPTAATRSDAPPAVGSTGAPGRPKKTSRNLQVSTNERMSRPAASRLMNVSVRYADSGAPQHIGPEGPLPAAHDDDQGEQDDDPGPAPAA